MTSLRAAVAGDLDAIVALEALVFGASAWSPGSIRTELDGVGGSRVVLVALDGVELAGYAVLTYAGGTGDVLRVAVAPAHRRRGIAEGMVRELLEAAWRGGCEQVLLEVAADNAAARALYERLGLREIARRPRYYPDGVDAVVMRREITVEEPT